MSPPIADLLASPDHYLHSFDGGDAIFVPMDGAAYRRSIFLDRRISCAADGMLRQPVDALFPYTPAPQQAGWIFHVAHCGSTLLARALDELDDGLVLREPLSLRQLALDPNMVRLKLAHALVTRLYPEQPMTIIKANVPVNFLLSDIASLDPAAPAICLYYGLPDYLLAILRSDNHRAWLRNVTGLLSPYLGETAHLADAELAAALWIAQLRQFVRVMANLPAARSLDAERFYADPLETLGAAAALFGKTVDRAKLITTVSGPLFKSYSKNPGIAFDNTARLMRRKTLEGEIKDEIALAEIWAAQNAPDVSDLLSMLESKKLLP